MQNPSFMCVLDCRRDRFEASRRLTCRQRFGFCQPGEAAAVDVIHRKVMLAFMLSDLVDRDDIRMAQACRSLGLRSKSPHKIVARKFSEEQHLYRNNAVQADLARAVNNTH